MEFFYYIDGRLPEWVDAKKYKKYKTEFVERDAVMVRYDSHKTVIVSKQSGAMTDNPSSQLDLTKYVLIVGKVLMDMPYL